ncbi:thiamine diphosphokinase [Paenibacillus allorhizosphaerae]|uniref:Thiamine diphosphokinase n=1 Tax=Paenibacillus allorhizosphaerae TaxID=2849866 RepID=A0ABN7TT42_9BACL|nr:thiamine diphosphokinase [Paenibacillus allorhizosphaerae]CAG7650023.1 Thiamine pyrophosphokinase [Paenibacillus allorhizosphaerae]
MLRKRIVIFSGGTLGEWAVQEIREGDVLVGADRGALYLIRHGYAPDMALGDFDSVTDSEVEQIRHASRQFVSCDPVMKDWTDTEMAFTWALEQGVEELVLCGALGTRWDHSLANVHLLRRSLDRGVACRIVDACNELMLTDNRTVLTVRRGRFDHVSLLPLSLNVTGITLSGFRYPLHEATLTIGQSLGISNVLLGEHGSIAVREGLLLVIQSTDRTWS